MTRCHLSIGLLLLAQLSLSFPALAQIRLRPRATATSTPPMRRPTATTQPTRLPTATTQPTHRPTNTPAITLIPTAIPTHTPSPVPSPTKIATKITFCYCKITCVDSGGHQIYQNQSIECSKTACADDNRFRGNDCSGSAKKYEDTLKLTQACKGKSVSCSGTHQTTVAPFSGGQ